MYYREDSVTRAEAETFQWITDVSLEERDKAAGLGDTRLTTRKVETRDSFLQWLRNGTGIYHVCGKAGSGKSTLMKLLCNSSRVQKELQSWAKPHQLVFAKFFFWSAGEKLQRSIEGLYRGILFEVLKRFPQLIPHIFPGTSTAFQALPQDINLPQCRLEEAKVAFMKLVALPATSNHRICLFIDGLDEYQGDSLDHEFMESFNCCPRQQIQLHQLTQSDIREYCLAMMKKDRNFERIKESYRELAENIVLRADGVFLWARLATRSFLGGVGYRDSPQTLRKKLAAIPEDMKTLFDNMLGGVDSSAREEADKLLLIASELPYPCIPAVLFSWLDDLHDVTFPYRVQGTGYSEKYLKNRVDIVRSKIDSLSKGLLELHTEPDTEGCGKYRVMFFHRTARDYLRDSKVNQLRNRLPDFNVQDSCCRLLLAYCLFSSMEYDRGRAFDKKVNIGLAQFELFRRLSHSPTSSKIVAVFQHMWGNSLFSHIPIIFYHSGRNRINGVAIRSSHPKNRFHYWCWLLCHDQAKFVLDRLSASASLPKDPSFQKQLFVLSVAYGHRDLVRVLLQKGVSPSDNFTVKLGKEMKESPMSLWMITLTLCAQQMIDDANSRSAGILLELLSWSSELDHDAFFLVHLHQWACSQMETLAPQQLKMISLQQLLSLRDTPESRELSSLITRRTQAHWWDRLMAGASPCHKMDYQHFTAKSLGIRIGFTEYIASKQEGKSLKEGLC
ncbi:hypothetical protein BDV35DRAFT_362798 [Aspergillus flavus]|uniref:NACHT domain-containing protein n=1 Tax=Aspergillus flavus TaxID=5059 RepID=A0A5N6GNK1_ASPFL|nr:hypothetical protein BDV35DRAFT_362798 [Aspergillus flavus]